MTRIAAAIGLTAALALPAQAQNFSGPYVGAGLGYVTGTPETTITAPTIADFIEIHDAVPFDGWDIGAFAGVRGTFGDRFVLGLEVGGSVGDIEGRDSTIFNLVERLGAQGRLRRQGEVTLALKAGVLVEPGTLVYAIAGAQAARFDFSVAGEFGPFGPIGPLELDVRERGTVPGWHFGLGAERAFTPNLSGRFEVIRYDYARLRASTGPVRIPVDPEETAVRIGIVYAF